MLNKLNAWLITRYPLLWNTRVVFVLPLVLLIHVLFFLAGYAQVIEYTDFYDGQIFRAKDVILFSCLITVVNLLIWLIYYLRNNPLKAHYPISRKYMFGEFMLLVLVFFSSATFFFTYRQGIYEKARSMTADTDLVEEANAINLAFHFIPMDLDEFKSQQNCDSIKARDMRRNERLKIYQRSLETEAPLDFNFVDDEPAASSDTSRPNYLNYCHLMILSLDEGQLSSAEENNRRAVSWLKGGNKDSVRLALERLQEILHKYKVYHWFSPQSQADSVFSNPDFVLSDWIFYNPSYDYEYVDTSGHSLINHNDLTYTIQKVEEIREGFWEYEMLIALLYYALGAAILLYSFRMIKARIWFAALIGTGLWAIVLGLVFSLFDIRDEGVISVFLFLFLAFLAFAIWLIRSRENKFLSGLIFLWAIWSQLAVLPLIAAFVMERFGYQETVITSVDGHTNIEERRTISYIWLKENIEHVFSVNLLLFLILLILIYIPLARKWQANPEE